MAIDIKAIIAGKKEAAKAAPAAMTYAQVIETLKKLDCVTVDTVKCINVQYNENEVADNYFYDGENAEGEVQGNWDFDKKGRFNINLTGGQKVTMLKMWRKDALETLIEWTEKENLFNGLLNVVPV